MIQNMTVKQKIVIMMITIMKNQKNQKNQKKKQKNNQKKKKEGEIDKINQIIIYNYLKIKKKIYEKQKEYLMLIQIYLQNLKK